MRTIINLVLIIVIAIVGYNYFFGDHREQAESREIVDQVKGLGKSIGDLMISEKEKFDQGKYNGLVERLRSLTDRIGSQLETSDTKGKEQLKELEGELDELERKVEESGDTISDQTGEELRIRLNQLLEQAERMLDSSGREE